MKTRISSIALLTVALSWTALAQQSPMRAGNWEMTMTMSMQGMNMPPMKTTKCVTAEQLKDPAAAVATGPNANECKVTNYNLQGSTATYSMTCAKPQPMTMTGELKYAGSDAYTGTVLMDMSGQKMSMGVDAKRLGDCPK